MANETPTAGRSTKPTRLAADLCDKLAELTEYLDVGSAMYLDPLVREQIEKDHKTHGPKIRAMLEAREAKRKERGEPALSNSLIEGQ